MLAEKSFSLYHGHVVPTHTKRGTTLRAKFRQCPAQRLIYILTNESPVREHICKSNVHGFTEADDTQSDLFEIVGGGLVHFAGARSLQLFLNYLCTLEA